jgi:molybdopterin molybdotransferase
MMLSVQDTQTTIFDLVQPFNTEEDTEVVDFLAANSRILACPVISQLDFPHWDNSAMDGYAVRYTDVQHANPQQPATLEIVEEIPAGYQPQFTIQSGQAARIFTGAVMPKGADTVVMQEQTRRKDNRVLILVAPKQQEFVRHRGSYYRAGAELLPAGIMLNAPEIAVLAAAQCSRVRVYRRPRVAILSIGDELVTANSPLQPGQIVDSNQYALTALVRQSGAEALMLGIIPDRVTVLTTAIAKALSQADIIVSSGGVSVGDYDCVEQAIQSLGGKIHVRTVAIKPGKPFTVATFPQTQTSCSKLYFGLPGNPAAVLVTFWRFVQPAIAKLSGLSNGWKPKFAKALTQSQLQADGKRETYIWGKLYLEDGEYKFQPAGGIQNSGNLINLVQTNAFAVLQPGQTFISVGEQVLVLQVS